MLLFESLTCETIKAPNAIDMVTPRFSWTIQGSRRAIMQSHYRVIVCSSRERAKLCDGDLWDTGWVPSDESVNILYNGRALASDSTYWWSVAIRDTRGEESELAKPARFETALLRQSDWKAAWIGPLSPRTSITGYQYGEKRSPFFRKEVLLPHKVKRARAFF